MENIKLAELLGVPPRIPNETKEDYKERLLPEFIDEVYEGAMFQKSMDYITIDNNDEIKYFAKMLSQHYINILIQNWDDLSIGEKD